MKIKKVQKREITIKEYEDGTYELIGPIWTLDNLKPKEIIEAFINWKNGNLEKYPNNTKLPKLIKDYVD